MHPLVNLAKYLYFYIRDLFIPAVNSKVKDKSLIIVKMDAIGDFILFRNFLKEIATSEKYKNYKITLVGNELWKSIAENLDSEWVNTFIWINPSKFKKEFKYRKQKVIELKKYYYSLLFHPTFSRDYYVSESIASFINAHEKITVEGDELNISSWQKKICYKNYSTILNNPENERFEFFKYQFLLQAFLECELKTEFTIAPYDLAIEWLKQEKYVILFIGGGADFRRWSVGKWKELIQQLLSNYLCKIVVAGGPDDIISGEEIKEMFKDEERVLNLCGQTSLLELISLISNAEWMISNESSPPHFAVALGTPVVVISNANHYGRFTPYPSKMNKKYYAVFPEIVMNEKDEDKRVKIYSSGSTLDINSIDSSTVQEALIRLLP